jgi:DNA ligase-associated metallophosphoesterase
MSTQSISFGNHIFEPQPCGALYWPSEDMVIVSDLHFEKSSHFAKKGLFLPPYDSIETLQKLQNTCDALNPKTILFLGDVFHDYDGLNRLDGAAKQIFDSILSTYKIIWVDGNHDKGSAPDDMTVFDETHINGITFTHIATSKNTHEISGHYHPCTSFKHKGHRVRKPCFVYDDTKLIMPSYGALTGGLDIHTDAITSIIPNPKTRIVR